MFGRSLQLGWRTLWIVLRWSWGLCRAPPALAAGPMRYSVSVTVQHLKSCRTYYSVRYPLSIRRLFQATTGSPSHPNWIILYSTDALFFQAALISSEEGGCIFHSRFSRLISLQRRPHTATYYCICPSCSLHDRIRSFFHAPLFPLVWLVFSRICCPSVFPFTRIVFPVEVSRWKRAPSRGSGRRYDWFYDDRTI